MILQHLLDREGNLREAAGEWPSYFIRKEKVAFPREALPGAYAALQDDLTPPDRDESDGLRMSWPEEKVWLHVRPSGTEPVVRLIAEGPSEAEVGSLLARAAEILDGVA